MVGGIRVFDTILDKTKKDSVKRNSADFWDSFCNASGWKMYNERVHSIADIKYFFEKRTLTENVIIFSGHGTAKNGFQLSNGDVIDENIDLKIKKENEQKIIIFSSCLIGVNQKLSNALKNKFKAKYLFAYQHPIQDRFCFLYESILLTLMSGKFENKSQTFSKKDFENFINVTEFMKNMNEKGVRKHPLIMY